MSRGTEPVARLFPLRPLLWFLALLAGTAALTLPAAEGGWHPVRLYRRDYVSADELASRYGFKATVAAKGKEVRLQSQWTKIELKADSREIRWNGLRLYLSESVVPLGKSLGIALSDVTATLEPLLQPGREKGPGRPRLVAIDAGHGGKDVGTQNRKLKLDEKTFTLDVARRLQRALEDLGFRTLLTRTSDQYHSLESRPAQANRVGADLFLSLHFNALANNSSVRGIETYSFTPASQRSTAAQLHRSSDRTTHAGNKHDHWNILLSASVHRELIEKLNAYDRGMKRARFVVLRDISCPAILVEGGFLSHSAEAQKIATPAYREQIAQAIAGGVKRYSALLDANSASSSP